MCGVAFNIKPRKENNMKNIIGRLIIIIPALAIQGLWYVFMIGFFREFSTLIASVLTVLAAVMVLYLVSKVDESSYKILWIIIILVMPFFGALLYLFWGNKKSSKPMKKRFHRVFRNMNIDVPTDNPVLEKLKDVDRRASQTMEYITSITGHPLCLNESAEYYSVGEEMFDAMREELKKAEKFIFLEYFIVQDGKFWKGITEILEEKAAAGVDVRFMYDDLGCISTFTRKDVLRLITKKIKVAVFNPLVFVTARLNNRDHRKIMVIDGKTAFSGGINIADEYINERERFGHWKDVGFRVTGDTVRNYTYMFMEFWNAFSISKIPSGYLDAQPLKSGESDGYVLSYYDSPFYDDPVSNNLFIELLSQSMDYIWFCTPYLVLGDNLLHAFIRAAKRGVDVRIMMPGIPDKKTVYRMSRSYYGPLLSAGVKIYEYTPGFLHSKSCVCDDKFALLGTVNLDYRSLFLHFECSSLFYRASIIADVKRDFEETQTKCTERTLENEKKTIIKRVTDSILRLFAPLC